VAQSCAVLIAAPDVQAAFRQRAGAIDGDVLVFSDAEALRALEAITTRRPRLVALERIFAATPRGAALINRIKADPALAQTEIRVLAHDSDYSRVLPRAGSAGILGAEPVSAPAAAPQTSHTAAAEAATATVAPAELDENGTRAAPRFKMQPKLEVLIDGNPATLIDLSTSGAQVVSVTILKPNQRVRMALSDDQGVMRFNAAIAWAAFEIPPKIGPQYRAGVEFVDADTAAIDAYCARHGV
jgi:PilZ domain-containing protein